MATNALAGFGTLLKIGDGGTPTEVFTTIAEVKDITPPKLSMDTDDVTHQTSPGGWKEKLPTLLDAGEVTFELNFIPTDATQGYSTGLIKDLVNKTRRNFQLVFPDSGSTTWAFAAFVTGFEPSAPVGGTLTASVTLTVTGQPTLA